MSEYNDSFENVDIELVEIREFTEEEIRVIINSLELSDKRFLDLLSTDLQGITDPIGQVAAWIYDRVKEISSWFAATVEALVKQFYNNIVVPALNAITSALNSLWTSMTSAITSINKILSDAWNVIQNIPGMLQNILSNIFSTLNSIFSAVVEKVSSFFSAIGETITSIGDRIYGALSSVWDWLRTSFETITATVREIFSAVVDTLSSIAARIVDAIHTYWQFISESFSYIINTISESFSAFGNTITSAFNTLYSYFTQLVEHLNTLAGYLSQFGAMVLGSLSNIAGFIMNIPNMLAEAFLNVFKGVIDFFSAVGAAISSFFSDPIGMIKKYILDPLWSGLQWLGARIFEGIMWLWEQIKSFANMLFDGIKSLIAGFQAVLSGLISWTINTFKDFAEYIAKSIESIWNWLLDRMRVSLETIYQAFTGLADIVRSIFSELQISSPPYLFLDNIIKGIATGTGISISLYFMMYITQLNVRVIRFALAALAHQVSHLVRNINISLKILGAGNSITFNLSKAMGGTIYSISEEIDRVSSKWLEFSSMGILFSYGQALSRLVTFQLRNFLPIEIPPLYDMFESLRRSRYADTYPKYVGKTFKDLLEGMKYYLAIRGFSDFYISLAAADEDEFYITIKDRFETQRKIPLSLRFTVPSEREVVYWLIRDVIIPPVLRKEELEKNIVKLLGIRGLAPDIAKLYYIAHFKYPSPSALARFYWRATAKVLWLQDSLEEKEIAEVVGATYKALSPEELNRKYQVVLEAIKRYWRWHDYAPFTWFPEFTTDKAIVFELTADLPRRIDLRWLMRWGIFEHLSAIIRARGQNILLPITDLLELTKAATGKELYSEKVTPEVSLDVRLLARLLEATGYHPSFIPILAVALSHQILADEMTLTRTGFLNTFREGLADLDTLEKLMSGLFIIKFYTGYIDTADGSWKDIVYNKPLLWLPGERRLLQLRSVFDRYVDLWRDFMKEVVAGVRRIAITSLEAASYMREFFNTLTPVWSKHIKSVVGVDWHPILDEEYIGLWIKYADLTRIIEARVWVRHYTARVMGWLMYRVSYGWLEKEDFANLIDALLSKNLLTQVEADYFLMIFDWLYNVVRKEYIPTPSTLATFSEYMVLDSQVVNKIFDRLRVPEEFRPLYLEYIRVRPVKSDFKTLLTAYRRAYVKGVISEEEWNRVLNEALQHGFRDIEISLIQRRADIESLIAASEEYVPTLAQLIQFSEYVGLSEELIDSVLNVRRVRDPWKQVWKQLIKARTIADDVRILLSSYYRAVRAGASIPDDLKNRVLYYFGVAGVTSEELEIRDLAALLESLIEVLPTLSSLATMSEYIEIPLDYITEILIKRRVEPRYAELWLRYIQVRAISREAGRIVSVFERLYERYSLPEDLINQIISLMSTSGWTQVEIELFKVEIEMRRWYRILSLLAPSVRTFIYDATYLPNWEAIFNDLLKLYGISPDQYAAQIEYYKALVKNRRLWRQFYWWRSQLTYAYQYGAIDQNTARQLLQKWKSRGLVDDDEINAILEALELRKSGYIAYRARRQL